MQTYTPAEVDAEQARQILGQIRTRAAQANDRDESVVRVGPLRSTCHGVERIDGVEGGCLSVPSSSRSPEWRGRRVRIRSAGVELLADRGDVLSHVQHQTDQQRGAMVTARWTGVGPCSQI